ncbi:MAG: hypothetical protein WD042_04810 [Phycisphaeraceae bacterium]
MKKFVQPLFADKSLELRFENGEVCIYGTEDGLRKLSSFCAQLADRLKGGTSEHIHLQDFEVLTPNSLPGVLAVFKSD